MAEASLTVVTESTLAAKRFISGAGVPSGVVSALPGATYIDTAKTWDVSVWVKTSGIGNLGWEPLLAVATPRNVTSLSTTPIAEGSVTYSRTVTGVTMQVLGVKPTADGNLIMFTNDALLSIAPTVGAQEFRVGVVSAGTTRRAVINKFGVLTIYGASAAEALYGSVHYNLSRTWAAPLGTVVTS